MEVKVKYGNIVEEEIDVLISSGNIYLNMSGGVNGEILRIGGQEVQKQLHDYLKNRGSKYVSPGTVVEVSAGPTKSKAILYAVGINAWYESSSELIDQTLSTALKMADDMGAKIVALPALGTGYGTLKISDYVVGLKIALKKSYENILEVRVVLNDRHKADFVKQELDKELF